MRGSIDRWGWLGAWACVACVAPRRMPEAPQRAGAPNVIVVVTDDQGYGDFGCHGNTLIDTPRLDAFAAECPKIARFYVSPVCSPTRASLMTGRWNYRTRVVDTYVGRSQMEPDEVTLAEALHAGGYRTGIFGKWHLGDAYPMRPMDQGFDTSLVLRGGGLAQPADPIENGRRYTDPVLIEDGVPVATTGYCTDVYFERAHRFIESSLAAGQPFFAYIATNAPHGPLHDVPADLYAKYSARDLRAAARTDGRAPTAKELDDIARIYAMNEGIDRAFGALLDHLDARRATRDTIVVFMSDNGPEPGRQVAGLRGAKTSVYEGGIRSPLWVRWPGHLDPGTTVTHPAAHVDLFPTLLELCAVAAPRGVALDGRSLAPLLRGADVAWEERALVLQSHRGDVPQAGHHFALIHAPWKLVRPSGFGREVAPGEAPFELFDLDEDPGETRDLAGAAPARVAALRAEYDAWFQDVATTRPDNFAPPRIFPGGPNVPCTVLTHQDWSVRQGDGWGRNGCWHLGFEREVKLQAALLFREPRAVERVLVRFGAGQAPLTIELGGERARYDLGALAFPAGAVEFELECAQGDARFGPYQVELVRP
ncbi:MAG: arylsulfatase [Planctomycetota bacterium]